MITVEKAQKSNGVLIKGDFFDLDRLYFAIYKYTGFHGIDDKCTFPGYEEVCENLLGLCYEIRHAFQGDRDIEQVYNGIQQNWFDEYKESDLLENMHLNNLDSQYSEDFDIEDETLNFEANYKFSRKDFPNITSNNIYFVISISFPEAIFYSLILLELLKKKDVFLLKRKLLAEENNDLNELNKEYYYFGTNEDISRITLFTNHVLNILYRFIGEEKYTSFMNMFYNQKDFFLNCNLQYINYILADYAKKEYETDILDNLYSVLMSFFRNTNIINK